MHNLKLYVDPNEPTLLDLYKKNAEKHNEEVLNNPYPNSGFDIYIPSDQYTAYGSTIWVDHKIKATMTERILCYKKPSVSDLEANIDQKEKQDDENKSEEIFGGIKIKRVPRGFCIYPRSSLSKTPLMLANHVGIIDSGYSGNLIGALRHVSSSPNAFVIEKETRLLQICNPNLWPFTVEIVDKEEDLFSAKKTKRGSGGFGSTGK